MNRGTTIVAAAGIAGLLAPAAWAAPVTRADFQLGTTANLVSLCAATAADPLYTAAINFCHGFMVATYRAISEEDAGSRAKRKLFCMSANPPNRNEAIAAFVTWAAGRQMVLSASPTDGVAEYLHTEFPCK